MPGRNQPRSSRGRSAIARKVINTNSTNGMMYQGTCVAHNGTKIAPCHNFGGMKKGGSHPSATGFMRSQSYKMTATAKNKNYLFNMRYFRKPSIESDKIGEDKKPNDDSTHHDDNIHSLSCSHGSCSFNTELSGCIMTNNDVSLCCASGYIHNDNGTIGCSDASFVCGIGTDVSLCNRNIRRCSDSPKPPPSTLQWNGNGKATTTIFTPCESLGQSLSCGCGGNKDEVYKLADELAENNWALTAPAQSMASPYTASGYTCGNGKDAEKAQSNTASAPCLSCFNLTPQSHPNWGDTAPKMTLNVIVGDACPANDNQEVCAKKPNDQTDGHCCDAGGELYKEGYTYNHFDIWSFPLTEGKEQNAIDACNTKRGSGVDPISDSYKHWTELSNKWEGIYGKSSPPGSPNWPVKFNAIECPQNIITIMKKYNCKTCS